MLSRTASNLYWMVRYLERAESTARLLDACFQPGMPLNFHLERICLLPLKIQSAEHEFLEQNATNPINIDGVSRFMISSGCMASVKSCLSAARENARSERSRLSSDVWEAINQTWLEFQDKQHLPLHDFTEWLRQRAFVFHGAVAITLPENLTSSFIHLGSYVERADQTLRVMEAKSELQLIHNQSEYYNWLMLLRAVSSFEAYQETFVEMPSEEGIIKFLIFNKNIPRSLRYCIEHLYELILLLKNMPRCEYEKLCNYLLVKLKFDKPADVTKVGVENYIHQLQDEVMALDLALQEGFFVKK